MKKTFFCSGKDAKRGVLLEGGEEAGEMDATSAYYRHNVARKYAKFFQSTLHHNNGYFAQVCLLYYRLYHQPTHCLLVLPRQSIYHQPPHSSQNFFSVCFQLCESHPSIKPSNHIAESIMCMPTNSLQNRLVPSKS